jgi:hypothetical protein
MPTDFATDTDATNEEDVYLLDITMSDLREEWDLLDNDDHAGRLYVHMDLDELDEHLGRVMQSLSRGARPDLERRLEGVCVDLFELRDEIDETLIEDWSDNELTMSTTVQMSATGKRRSADEVAVFDQPSPKRIRLG